MKPVFADASYWIAVTNRKDQWNSHAKRAKARLGEDVRMVTTEGVLVELLNALASQGAILRGGAVRMVRAILDDPDIEVVALTHEQFEQGLDRYEQRADKTLGMTDCIAMNVMQTRGLREALTSDRDFEREGFVALMRQEG